MAKLPPTWNRFRSAVRRADRDSLLVTAAVTTAMIARDEMPTNLRNLGLNPWNIGDVARTSLAWGQIRRKRADVYSLLELSNENAQIIDESDGGADDHERLARILARTFFEQFPSQRAIMPELARTILMFGSAAEFPDSFEPASMQHGWFERATSGLTLDEYVEAIFLISVGAQSNDGRFDPTWLDGPQFQRIKGLISFEAVHRTFADHLVTTVPDFRDANRRSQEPLPDPQKKFAFNPLMDKPFIVGVSPSPIAPMVQAVIQKALPPSVYHLGLREYGENFTHDLGAVFQHYTGRQLNMLEGQREVLPEVRYGTRRQQLDSCDWFLALPHLLVLVECKARQPVESLRTGGSQWMSSVEGSIGKGIKQVNRSNAEIAQIAAVDERLDQTKPRVGLVVTLEPFYVNQNFAMWDKLPKSAFPVGVLSVGELEHLVRLRSDELERLLLAASAESVDGALLLHDVITAGASSERENPLIAATWDSIGLFKRTEEMARSFGDNLE